MYLHAGGTQILENTLAKILCRISSLHKPSISYKWASLFPWINRLTEYTSCLLCWDSFSQIEKEMINPLVICAISSMFPTNNLVLQVILLFIIMNQMLRTPGCLWKKCTGLKNGEKFPDRENKVRGVKCLTCLKGQLVRFLLQKNTFKGLMLLINTTWLINYFTWYWCIWLSKLTILHKRLADVPVSNLPSPSGLVGNPRFAKLLLSQKLMFELSWVWFGFKGFADYKALLCWIKCTCAWVCKSFTIQGYHANTTPSVTVFLTLHPDPSWQKRHMHQEVNSFQQLQTARRQYQSANQ